MYKLERKIAMLLFPFALGRNIVATRASKSDKTELRYFGQALQPFQLSSLRYGSLKTANERKSDFIEIKSKDMMETAGEDNIWFSLQQKSLPDIFWPFKSLITKPIAFRDNKTKGHTN